ncbi:hypothetical protein W97_01716 [Coniosporium apollinis CBS 100218]|uniref:Uncharacterized protein n=1 Tax=Coniosporium apollinis (strain CBS 100218) TaxID=1168221 RepID=R7YKT2_CONA1|nr:uncharacterized protein W97_01716 [Coniosporium apollinis CBS 100218]EON62493.1 hypothetical protein W97_01716 [Coniosporium apollinis CBS 100218]
MALKRKRSNDGFSPISTSSFLSTSTYGSQSPTPAPRVQSTGSMIVDGPVPSNSITAWTTGVRKPNSSDLNSRTRKRFRDNRPDESVIHENTISKLFTAQREYPHAAPVLSQPLAPPPTAVPTSQKSTLHAFWNLPPTHAHTVSAQSHTAAFEEPQGLRCDDCDTALAPGDSMDVDMGGSAGEYTCASCGRRVCDTCAVVGDERRCLHCAMSS